MNETISQALAEIINLRNASDCHKKDCQNQDCSVSLYLLRRTAQNLLSILNIEELPEATKLIEEWPR